MLINFKFGDYARVREEYNEVLSVGDDFELIIDSTTAISVRCYQIDIPEIKLSFREGVLYRLSEENWEPESIVGIIYHLNESSLENPSSILACIPGTLEHALVAELRAQGHEIADRICMFDCEIDTSSYALEEDIREALEIDNQTRDSLHSDQLKFTAKFSGNEYGIDFESEGADGVFDCYHEPMGDPYTMFSNLTKVFWEDFHNVFSVDEEDIEDLHPEDDDVAECDFSINVTYQNSWLDISYQCGAAFGTTTLPLYCTPTDCFNLFSDLYQAFLTNS